MTAVTVLLLALATARLLGLELGRTADSSGAERFALVILVPLASAFMYLLAVFSFGLDGDLAGRPSIYPTRLFTLPVTTASLAAWPMLYGTASVAILWLATRCLAPWPPEMAAPATWPAFLAAAVLAWTQALTWMPYRLPGLRVIVTVLWLAVMDTVVIVALHHEAREAVMIAILAPQLPLAYVAARYAVSRARRGDVPDGRRNARVGTADAARRPRKPFRSAARAQVWLEWRTHGRTLPASVALLLPFELALLFLAAETDTPSLVFSVLLAVLATPPFMAAFAAATVSTANPSRDSHGLAPFMATRPLTDAALTAPKLQASLWSTLAAWLLVLLAVPLALGASGTWPVILERAHRLEKLVGTPRAFVILLLGLAALFAWTWKHLVQALCIGLTGREWLIKSSVVLALSFLVAALPVARWIVDDPEVQVALWHALPWLLAVLVCVKTSAAAWIAVRLHSRRVLADRTLVAAAACWLVSVLALYGVLEWVFWTPQMPSYLLLLVAILGIPLARVSAAPLALAWNRHR
jgi:hypothetical protein